MVKKGSVGYIRKVAVVMCCCGLAMQGMASRKSLADYVNPMIGASTNIEAAGAAHGLGKTFPGATTPFGMVQVSPNTITGGDNGPGYSDEHRTIEGFAMTQMSGIGWYGDLGNFLVMPTVGPLQVVAGKEDGSIEGYRSHYDKASEVAQAGYYAVQLSDYQIRTECSATPHCGILQFTFPAHQQSRIQIDLARRVGGSSSEQYCKVVNDSIIEGWMRCTPDGGGWGNGGGKARYTVYFHAVFSKPLSDFGFWRANIPDGWSRKNQDVISEAYLRQVAQSELLQGCKELTGKHIGFYTQFATRKDEQVTLKVGISFVDVDGARNNYQEEMLGMDFHRVRAQAKQRWNDELGKIKVKGGTETGKVIFYTALYHTMIDPRVYCDVDGRYVGGDLKVHQSDGSFTKRTIFSGWDVFRSQFPLQTLINPRMVSDVINSLVTLARESGNNYLERWEFLNAYSGCMIGHPAISVILDAYSKGIRTFNVEEAYQMARNTSYQLGNRQYGYVPADCISNTLEYAYSEWCMAQFAAALNKTDDAELFGRLAQSYRNIFDAEKGWFRPRNADGSWAEWPSEGRLKQNYGCVECNPYQQGWFVPHDVEGMVSLMGGRDKVLKDLDAFFSHAPQDMLWNDYYNHANEPVQAIPYLFNRLGQPWKTQEWTRHICTHAYHNKVEGIVGNDDVGQMSAWYVLSALGMHPYCPGDGLMELTSPLFDEIVIQLDQQYFPGSRFVIKVHHNSEQNIYIQRMSFNGKPYRDFSLPFADIVKGGRLDVYMGPDHQ